MKQALLFLGLSLLMGTIALFALYGYNSFDSEPWLTNGAKIATAYAAPVEAATSETQTHLLKGVTSVTRTNPPIKSGTKPDIRMPLSICSKVRMRYAPHV